MMTGEIPITHGQILVNGKSVSNEIDDIHQNIGYCPQTNAIVPLLTAREHLILFARLRGIPEKYVKQVSEWALNRFGLEPFADCVTEDFSGGNKRKLSTAIAIIGNPAVVCLDEPTSGYCIIFLYKFKYLNTLFYLIHRMDSNARRLLWNDIISLVKEKRVVIFTSHSMEECEALCNRLVIMVNGSFKCMGSPNYLKNKYDIGYKVTVRLENESFQSDLIAFMEENFAKFKLKDIKKEVCEFVVPLFCTKLSEIFSKFETNIQKLKIVNYTINQTNLDELFINFAKK
jgi:ATP-binding cassette subfamily A (ABC1) protein 1